LRFIHNLFLELLRGSTLAIVAIFAALIGFSFLTTNGLGDFSITILSGLLQGMLLFLVASGLSIIFGLMDVLNFAQGAYFMIGAYIGYEIHHAPGLMQAIPDGNLRFLLGVVVAVGVGAVLGAVLERGLLRPLYSRPIFQLVTTFGVSIILLEVVRLLWGTSPRSWTNEFSFNEGTFSLFGQQFSIYRLFVIMMGFGLIVAVALLLRRTRIGIIIRAGVEDSTMVEALGINVRLVFTAVFTLGCALAAFGGVVAAPFLGASNTLGSEFLLGAITAVVLGGMGSYEGTAVASLVVGLARAVVAKYSTTFLNQPVWVSLTPMILMALVLLLRPKGLFGKD
jgi:branched-chain amino acid transport system permease protein